MSGANARAIQHNRIIITGIPIYIYVRTMCTYIIIIAYRTYRNTCRVIIFYARTGQMTEKKPRRFHFKNKYNTETIVEIFRMTLRLTTFEK